MNTVKRRLLPAILAVLAALVAVSVAATTEEAHAVTFPVAVDSTNFPDPVWRDWVNTNCAGGDGELTEAEAEAVTSVDVSSSIPKITDLTGVEYFENLTDLDCSHNDLAVLDLSNNPILTHLFCGDNGLTALDLSNNPALDYLSCYDNKLTQLNLSANTALTELYCNGNDLVELNLSANTALTKLWCYDNDLVELNLSANTALTELYCYGNNLVELNLSANTLLTDLYCDDNHLTTLNLSKNTLLTTLYCNDNHLTTLDLPASLALEFLYCNDNDLTTLDLSNNPTLTYLSCSDNDLTTLDLSKNTLLTTLYCDDNDLTTLDLSNNPALISLMCHNNMLAFLNVDSNSNINLFWRHNNSLLFIEGMLASAIGNHAWQWEGQTVTVPVIADGSGGYVSAGAWLPPDAAHSLSLGSSGVSYDSAAGLFATDTLGQADFETLLDSETYLSGTISFVEVEAFTVTFIDWNDAVLSVQAVAQGESATAPADPTRPGYVFAGWDKDFTDVQEDLTVQATYTPVPAEDSGSPVPGKPVGDSKPLPPASKLATTGDSGIPFAALAVGLSLTAGIALAATASLARRRG